MNTHQIPGRKANENPFHYDFGDSFHHMLHMGCDQKRIATIKPYYQNDWRETRLDLMPEGKPDLQCDVLDLSGIPSKAFQSIYSSHNIEHVYAYQADGVLKEMRRMLDDGGFAFIRTPDMQSVAKIFAEQGPDAVLYHSPAGPITPHDVFYGKGTILAQGSHFMAHKCGYSSKSLLSAMAKAGFGQTFIIQRQLELFAFGFTHKFKQEQFPISQYHVNTGLPIWVDAYFHAVQNHIKLASKVAIP